MNPWVRARGFLRPIHRSPADARDAWIHHGFRASVVLLIALAIPWLFPRTTLPEFEGLVPGSVADRDVIAEISFGVEKSRAQLVAEREEAVEAVASVLIRDVTRADSSIVRSRALFSALDSVVDAIREAADPDEEAAELRSNIVSGVATVAEDFGVPFPTVEQIALLVDATERNRLRMALRAEFDGPLRRGVVRRGDLPDLALPVILRVGGRDLVQASDTIQTMQAFYSGAVSRVVGTLPQAGVPLFSALLVLYAEPTLWLDTEATRRAREQARAAVTSAAGFVYEGERIITQHTLIGEREADRLEAYQAALIDQGLAEAGTGFWRGLGMTMLAAALLGILVFATYTFRREIYEDLRSFSVLLVLILIVLAVSGIIAKVEAPPALIPVAFAALLVAALFDAFLALVVVSAIAGILLGQVDFEGLSVPMLTVAGGATAAFAVREIRRRSQSWVLIALITGAYAATGLCLVLIGRLGWSDLLVTGLAGFGNATVCTALAMGAVLPALETFTRRTTEQTLLELADMNRPLLRRLAREAPGTYAHSINMANLVEAACSATGADSLLARVGVYYHDVGKLSRPQYFIENQPQGLNPHDRLRPSQSAQILRAHVRDGLVLAEEAKLPRVVKDFIREHHGTQRIEFFFHKARSDEPDHEIDPNDFCYPGPKPQTKETAIAMLADAVESAARTLSDPSPERIRALIQKLSDARVNGGQLDECGLTFRDLDRVKREFAHVLTGLYHHRIDYPDPVATRIAAEADRPAQSDTGSPPTLDDSSGDVPAEQPVPIRVPDSE